eukprot:1136807-Pelagomonas_calceolata.AAC.4
MPTHRRPGVEDCPGGCRTCPAGRNSTRSEAGHPLGVLQVPIGSNVVSTGNLTSMAIKRVRSTAGRFDLPSNSTRTQQHNEHSEALLREHSRQRATHCHPIVQLKSEGWPLDANGYTTSFRMTVKGKSQEQLQAAISAAPKELQSTFNCECREVPQRSTVTHLLEMLLGQECGQVNRAVVIVEYGARIVVIRATRKAEGACVHKCVSTAMVQSKLFNVSKIIGGACFSSTGTDIDEGGALTECTSPMHGCLCHHPVVAVEDRTGSQLIHVSMYVKLQCGTLTNCISPVHVCSCPSNLSLAFTVGDGADPCLIKPCVHVVSLPAVGHADFYPASSGKVGAARHLIQRFGTSFDLATFMCDDDNVGGFAQHAYVCGLTQHAGARGLTQHAGARGLTQHAYVCGLTQHADARGLAQHAGARGLAQHAGARGLTQHADAHGLTQHADARGLAQHAGARGLAQHAGARGLAQHAGARGLTQHADARGLTQHADAGGLAQHAYVCGLTQHADARGLTQHAGARGLAHSV